MKPFVVCIRSGLRGNNEKNAKTNKNICFLLVFGVSADVTFWCIFLIIFVGSCCTKLATARFPALLGLLSFDSNPNFFGPMFFLQIRFCWSISPSERVTWISRLQFKEHFKEHATSRGRASKQHNDGAKTNTHHDANLVPMLRQWKYHIFQNKCPDNMLLIACKIQCETQVYSSKATVRPCKTKQMLCKTAASPMSRPCKHRAMSCQKNPEPGDIDKHVSEKHARSKVKNF